ncbi:maltose ABC transporter substrate-binding protein [Dermacoccus sp. 147Ba]|uniref:sugar ABC transporter substrate-binding protein n=1 Tax=Dermacoccus sp. 147Ba TaxID=2510111 RepID=UPI00101D7A34|nr:maltose ABC transporter substrate-binding protein [Dermacoccus sp. 147Ba]RYI21650.1 maltose ABC transporter substrate-binding protein [Dermacoccus sp. 147Ba]
MTKRSVAVALAGVVAFSLSACGGTDSSSSKSSSKSSGSSASGSAAATGAVNAKDPKRDASADLVIWTDGTAAPTVSKLASEFARQNGVKVSVQTATDVRGNYNTAFKAGQAPDIIVGAHDWMGELVANGSVAPVQLSAQTAAGFNPVAITASKYNGQTYGVPYAVENMALVRNTAYAKDAPKTLDELIATGQKAVDSKKATNVLALEMGKVGDAYHGYPFLSGFKGGIFGTKDNGDYDANKLMVNSPETLKGANLLAELGKKKVLSTNIDKTNADNLFANGKAAYTITGPWSLPTYDKAGVKYAVSAMPTVEGGGKMTPFLGVQMFYVSSKAKNATVAQTFATSLLTTEAAQKQLFEVGKRPPALKAAFDAVAKTDPQVAQWAAAGEGAKPMPNIPAMNAVWQPLGQALADVISGKSAPDARFNKAQSEIQAAIKAGN